MGEAKKVLIVGGRKLTQSLWSVWRGFCFAGCDVRVVHTFELRDGERRKVVRPAHLADIASELRQGVDFMLWWGGKEACVEDLRLLREEFPSTPFVLHSIDDPRELIMNNPPQFYEFDVVATCCVGSFPHYVLHGVKPIMGHTPCDREAHGKAVANPDEVCDVSIAATNLYAGDRWPAVFASRKEQAEAAARAGAHVHVYGEKDRCWHGEHGWVPGEEPSGIEVCGPRQSVQMPGIYAASRINIGSHVCPQAYLYFNRRLVECTASGGFMLSDKVTGIESVFKPDTEIVLWSTVEEIEDKVRWWNDPRHDMARQLIAVQGRRRSLEVFDNERLARRIIRAVEAL